MPPKKKAVESLYVRLDKIISDLTEMERDLRGCKSMEVLANVIRDIADRTQGIQDDMEEREHLSYTVKVFRSSLKETLTGLEAWAKEAEKCSGT